MMNLELQFKVIFYCFIYGILFFSTLKLVKRIKIKNILYKFLIELLFIVSHTLLFYFLLYKINGGILNFYVFLFLIFGSFFCKVFYFSNKNH